ncbi:hypothetical protein E2562_004690 [Oryza meyeriana var. granulata]|uniref:DUF674 domain-containing protein n=1 Tax=Oryza meyeriana var. granulata TaxID=110450 RepID=A0A6G1DDK7_9ORYZ|nr:hypothetical protein E2562_004690 [Oryza meyeriana var. granulata]
MATAANDTTPTPAPAKPGCPQLKLLVDKRSRRVLYAEARKDAVDFLVGLLRVPAGLAARVLAKHGVAAPGSLGALYAGARALDDAFLASPTPDRDAVLGPAALPSAALPLLGESLPPPPPPKRYFRCPAYALPCRSNPTNVTDVSGLSCPSCRQPMTVEMRWAPPGDAPGGKPAQAEKEPGGGYVKEVVTYLVMDNLTIESMSTISAIMLLKKFDVKDCSALDEMTVDLGPKECVKLLKASLESTTALTDVFSSGVSIDRL